MSRNHLYMARTIETLSALEICALIEANDKDSGVPVMERLVMGAYSAPRLVNATRLILAPLEEAERLYSSRGLIAAHTDAGPWINAARDAIRQIKGNANG